jgi:hypothetical protein
MAPPSSAWTLLLWGWLLLLLSAVPACFLVSSSPDPGAGEFSNLEATCTVTNPHGTVAHHSLLQYGAEQTWFGAQVPTSQEVGKQECSIPAGEQVKVVGVGGATREVIGLGEAQCYGTVPTADLGQCSGSKAPKARSGRHR